MQILDYIIIVFLIYGCIKKYLGYSNIKQYEKEGAQVYRYQSNKQKFFQYGSLVLSVLFAGLFAYNVIAKGTPFNTIMISTVLLFFYFGFLPTSNGYWALTKKGIYFYLYDRYIKWPEIIKIGVEQSKKNNPESPFFLTAIIKKQKGEIFKQVYYRCVVPKGDIKMVEDFIAAERKRVDRIKLRRKQGNTREELKKTGKR